MDRRSLLGKLFGLGAIASVGVAAEEKSTPISNLTIEDIRKVIREELDRGVSLSESAFTTGSLTAAEIAEAVWDAPMPTASSEILRTLEHR